jgi:hypothetical protein
MRLSAEYWRQRAQEAQNLAASVQDHEVRQALLRISLDYRKQALELAEVELEAARVGGVMHWRLRAEEARVLAEEMRDEDAKRSMLHIASEYEKMADRADEREAEAAKAVRKSF